MIFTYLLNRDERGIPSRVGSLCGSSDSWGEQVFLCNSHNMQVLLSDFADNAMHIKRLLEGPLECCATQLSSIRLLCD